MYRLSACLLVFCLLSNHRDIANAQNPTSNTRQPYPAQFVRDYSNECLQTSMAEGLEELEARQLCQCTLDEFQKQYSLQEFKKLTAASATDKTAENSLIEVGQLCFESLLYEQ
jgi:hypothetical protein